MNPPDDKEAELRLREQELRQRELALRLRELEAEIQQPPLYPTIKHHPPDSSVKRWTQKLIKIAQFLGLVVAVLVAIRIAIWLSTVVIVAAIIWVIYKIFIEGDQAKR